MSVCPPTAAERRTSREVRDVPILLQKSAVTDCTGPFESRDVDWPLSLLRNSDATQCTEPQQAAVVLPVLRAVVGSERWLQEQTRPERRAGRAIAVARV
jgi:hypothetical protein